MSELHIIFDGPPSHESGRFVEVETSDGYSIDAGKWEQRGDYWHLILPNDRTAANKRITELEAALAAVTAERDALKVDAAWCLSLENWWLEASDEKKKRAYAQSIAADTWKAKRIRELEEAAIKEQP